MKGWKTWTAAILAAITGGLYALSEADPAQFAWAKIVATCLAGVAGSLGLVGIGVKVERTAEKAAVATANAVTTAAQDVIRPTMQQVQYTIQDASLRRQQ